MSKLILLRGLPGSGKSYWAKELVEASGYNYVRINRDSLRNLLNNGHWQKRDEDMVVRSEKALAKVALDHGKSVIIDDTNLTDRHVELWRNWTNGYNATRQSVSSVVLTESCQFEIKSFFEIPLVTCVMRDLIREGKERVGKAVIHKMALRNKLIQWQDKKIVIFDVDGTLSDPGHRLHYVNGPKKDWNKFFELCINDDRNLPVIEWCNALSLDNYCVVVVSGRPADKCQESTLRWLDSCIYFDYIFMRDGQDFRKDIEVKQEILDLLPKDKIEFVVDDRPEVIEMWRKNGLKVYPVGSGKEF
jgi:predicted kinase